MKKVVFSVTKLGKFESKQSGIGYVTDSNLVIAYLSKSGKPYILVFDDCIKSCHEITNKPNEFKGSFYEIREVPLNLQLHTLKKVPRELTLLRCFRVTAIIYALTLSLPLKKL